jgi:polyisoprenoid-binding protein YceI
MTKILVASLLAIAAAAVSAEPVTFAIDPNHTVVTFEITHFGTSTHRGRFKAKEGTVVLDRAAKTGTADITIDATTVSVATPSFEGVLKGERVFNVTQNPVARFVADSFAFEGDKVTSATGTLTIVGKSQPVTLKATRFNCYENSQLKREVCGGDFETTIQRSQFGLGIAPAVAPDDVKLLIQVEGIRQ